MEKNQLDQLLTTVEAASYLRRKPQTLRKWSHLKAGPVLPIRIHGRLLWRVSDLDKLVKGDET